MWAKSTASRSLDSVAAWASISPTFLAKPWTTSMSSAARNPPSTAPTPTPASSISSRAARAPQLDILAEGGSHNERRFAITGAGTIAGFGLLVSASRYDNDGLVANDDYRNEDVLLNLTRRFGRHSLSMHGYFDSNEVGQPGAWGSDPKHTFTGIDTVSRAKNNFSEYGAHYEADE